MKDLRILVTGVGAIAAPSIIKNYKVVSERNIYVVGVDIKPSVTNKYIDKPITNNTILFINLDLIKNLL